MSFHATHTLMQQKSEWNRYQSMKSSWNIKEMLWQDSFSTKHFQSLHPSSILCILVSLPRVIRQLKIIDYEFSVPVKEGKPWSKNLSYKTNTFYPYFMVVTWQPMVCCNMWYPGEHGKFGEWCWGINALFLPPSTWPRYLRGHCHQNAEGLVVRERTCLICSFPSTMPYTPKYMGWSMDSLVAHPLHLGYCPVWSFSNVLIYSFQLVPSFI
jgi:hypothetical protein